MSPENKDNMYDEFEDEQEESFSWFKGQTSAPEPEKIPESVLEQDSETVEEPEKIDDSETPEKTKASGKSEGKNKKSSQKTKKKKKRRRKTHRSARVYGVLMMLTLIFVISITLAIGIIEVGKDMLGVDGTETLVVFNIPEGATTADIADSLAQNGIIRIPKAFVYFSRLSKSDSKYIAGDHEVSSSMAYETIISELTGTAMQAKNIEAVDVMFPEGCTLVQAAEKLEEAEVCDGQKFLFYFNQGNLGYKFEEYLPKNNSSLKFMRMEGYLFPDTYTFYKNMEPDSVCQKIYVNFDTKMTQEMYDRIEEMDTTLDEVITLASMVQAEASNVEDMSKIASVFWNRLNNPSDFGGRLQSDPTKKYVDQTIKPNIDLSNQQMYDAYDTYVCKGLPAGAINNPGIEAINAVLWPANTRYYYFYANIDTGKTYFAKTLEEHNENIEKVKQEQEEATTAAEEDDE